MAQHAILRFEKHKGHPAGPLEAHHERKKEQYASNPDIDTSRSKYNFHIVKPDGRYYHFIQSRIEQARCRTRKDSTRFVDTLITASPEFFKGKSPKEIAAYFQRAADFLIDRVGRENIVSANAATRTTALINGEVDFISNIPVMDVNRLENDPNVQVITNPSLSCNYMGFDQLNEHGSAGTDDPNPLLNVKVRQAIYHAIDIQTIIDTVMNGYATVANSYMPSICVGYNADAERPAYDPELAKQLLAEAGYPDGFYLRIDARNDSDVNADQVSQAIASYLEKVGIKAEVNLLPRASFYEKTSAENLQSSFFMAGWGDSSGEGMVIFNDMLYTYDGKPGMGEGNRGHYSNAEVDALLDQASVEPDQAKRAALVEQVDQIARDEAAYIPLFFKHNIFGVRAGIQYTPSCDDHILAWDFTF